MKVKLLDVKAPYGGEVHPLDTIVGSAPTPRHSPGFHFGGGGAPPFES